MATAEQAVSILNRLVERLRVRQSDSTGDYGAEYGVETLQRAYNGAFPLRYASDNFREFFATRYSSFADNWCGIVADAPHERLEPVGIRLKGETTGDDGLFDLWRDQDADAECDKALLDAIIAKRAYGLVWGDDARITFEHPSQAIVDYDPETRERRAGVKLWGDDDREFATLYLPNEVWKFQRDRISADGQRPSGLYVPTLSGGWTLRDEEMIPNPMGKVPLVELPNRPRLMGEPMSDISGALAMQHAINLLWSHLFAVSDEATLGQRIVLGAEQPMTPILDADGQIVGEKPVDLKKLRQDNILWIEDEHAKIGQWKGADFKVFTDVVEKAVSHIGAQSRTPSHYLLNGGNIANISADAMKALESGLVKRTQEKTQHFGRGIRDIFELVALAQGDERKAAAVRGGQVLWRDIENRTEAQRADAMQKKASIGYPFEFLLEQDGLPPHEIERVMKMKREEGLDTFSQAAISALGGIGGNADATAG